MPIGLPSATEFSINSGLASARPVDPLEGSIYLATDTGIMSVCFENGVWTEQTIPVKNPLTIDEFGTLNFNGNRIIPLPDSTNYTFQSWVSGESGWKSILVGKTGIIKFWQTHTQNTAGYAKVDYRIRMMNGPTVLDSWTSEYMSAVSNYFPAVSIEILNRFYKKNPNHDLQIYVRSADNNANTLTEISTDSGFLKVSSD